jgi:hypothetical protein
VTAPAGTTPTPPRRPAERGNFVFGLAWFALGLVVLAESWRMPRLEEQGVNPYTVPGLVPGLLGVVLALFGAALALRGWRGRRGTRVLAADETAPPEEGPPPRAEPWRAALALALCLGFGFLVLGRGPPFWLAAGLFLFLAILSFELPDRLRQGTLARGALIAFAVAAFGAAAVTFVFQEVFLVRLP